jgi:hypothetical protein
VRVLFVVLATVAALLAAAPAASAAKRSVPPFFFGMNWDGEVEEQAPDGIRMAAASVMASSGVESERVAFQWAKAQPEEGMPFDHAKTDRAVRDAVTHGVDVLPVVILSPRWARQYPDEHFSPPVRIADYTRYLRAVVDRYGPGGSFWEANPKLPERPIRQWQIWNEVHLKYQWYVPSGIDYAPGYGELLRAAYRTVNEADPGAKVVLAGLTGRAWKILEHLYRDGGIAGAFDVGAVHPYTARAAGVVTIAARFRAAMRRRGDGKLPLWVTELGLPSSKGRSPVGGDLYSTANGMAKHLRMAYRLLAQTRSSPLVGVERAYWYTWASSYRAEPFRYTGLLGYDGESNLWATPALKQYVLSARRYEGCMKDAMARCLGPGYAPSGPTAASLPSGPPRD